MAYIINGAFDANEWQPATQLGTSTNPVGYALYGAVDGNAFIFALQGAAAISFSTTVWLNTDQNTATGYQIFGLNTGADFNITFVAGSPGAAAAPYLYTGADAQNYLADITEFAFSADRQTVEFRVPFSLLALSAAPAVTDVYADINNSIFLPQEYARLLQAPRAPGARQRRRRRQRRRQRRWGRRCVGGQPTPVHGTAGDDTLTGSAGNDAMDGGAGYDTAAMGNAGFRGAGATWAGGNLTITSALGTDTLANIEVVTFADGRLVMDENDPAARVTRLYEAGLNRLPDQGGLNFWIDAVQGGQSLSGLAGGFIASPEFQARFGGATSSNDAFVDQLYLNVLGRAAEQGGRDFWVNSLDRGAASRAEVLVGISESPENKAGTAALVQAGIWDRSEAATEVARLYDTVFGRLPDMSGLVAWKTALENGSAILLQVANSFTQSAEFRGQYGDLGNRDFANALYVNTLDRPADQAGLDHWTGVLNSGVSRAEVVLAFSESAEHIALTAANIQSESPGQYGILFA